MFVYEPSVSTDLILTHWYAELRNSGDMDRIFGKDLPLTEFFSIVMPPVTDLCFDLDERNQMWAACWFQRMMSGAFVGVWLRSDKRKSPSSLKFMIRAHEMAFVNVNILFATTRQPKLIEEHEKFGYSLVGKIPRLWGEEPGWLFSLSKEDFEAAWPNRGN